MFSQTEKKCQCAKSLKEPSTLCSHLTLKGQLYCGVHKNCKRSLTAHPVCPSIQSKQQKKKPNHVVERTHRQETDQIVSDKSKHDTSIHKDDLPVNLLSELLSNQLALLIKVKFKVMM